MLEGTCDGDDTTWSEHVSDMKPRLTHHPAAKA